MSFFDKLFKRKSKSQELKEIIESSNIMQGIVPNKFVYDLRTLSNTRNDSRDRSKGIDSKQWDALPEEARKTLKEQGFYPIIKI